MARSPDCSHEGQADPGVCQRARRRRSQLRGASARRAPWRHRAPPAHRAVAQRAGLGRSCVSICAAASRCSRRASAASWKRSRRRAAGAEDALMPAFTHFRPAQPVLVAHFFLAHVRRHSAAISIDSTRPVDEADALPLGSGAIAGTSYAIDVHQLARDLGFSRVVDNSIDASSDRDFAATFLYACSLTMVHLSRSVRGSHRPLRRRAPILRVVGRAQHRQQHDAAEEESRSARARARKDRSRDRPPDGDARPR